jgi:inhibitor of KinA
VLAVTQNSTSARLETEQPGKPGWPKYRLCGETAVSVELGDSIDPVVNFRVHELYRNIRSKNITGVLSVIPTYRSVLIQYDPWQCSYEQLLMQVERLLNTTDTIKAPKEVIEIPVCYDLELAPDLKDVASMHEMSVEEIVSIHSTPNYYVYMIGFTPGFPYLGGLDPRLFTPRKATPRIRVPAGSVGIADQQTGIYPIESPGGWQLIGRTPLKLFDPDRTPPFLVKAGVLMRFKPITRDEYENHRNP